MSAAVRCDEHVGLPYPPRCLACDAAVAEVESVPLGFRPERLGPAVVPRDDAWPVPADEPDDWLSDE